MESFHWWFWPLVYTAGIVAALDALWQNRTAQGTVAWIIALLLMPVITLPIYLLIGSRRFRDYRRARRQGDDKLSPQERQLRVSLNKYVSKPVNKTKPLRHLFRVPMIEGNATELFIDGKDTFNAILNTAQAAQHTLCVQFYIFRDDALGRRFSEVMCAKAKLGIKVYLLYDEIGSGGLDKRFLQELSNAGVQVSRFNPVKLRNRTNINFRNHRKLVIVDGQIAFVGGHNVGIEYLGLDPDFGPWRDTHMSINGPATLAFQLSFSEDWHWATGKVPELDWSAPKVVGDKKVMCVNHGPADHFDSGPLFFNHMISSAQHRCWLVSPYFVPDQTVYSALQLAALRGVDVRIMLPTSSHSWMVDQAMRSYVVSLTQSKVKFFTYQPGFLHQKIMLIDDEWASVGSANLDNRSLSINFEIAALIHDQAFAHDIEQMLLNDFEHCQPTVVDQRWWKQLLARTLRLMAPIL